MNLKELTSLKLSLMVILSLLLPSPHKVLSADPVSSTGPAMTSQQQQAASPNQNDDRSQQSGAAAAAAAAGAAMAGLSCVMLLRQAQQAPPDQKAMLQAMGAQQCAQAAQNMASAAQNSDQKKKLDAPPPIQAPPFQAPEVKEAADGEKPDFSSLAKNDSSNSSGDNKDPNTNTSKPFEVPTAPETKKVEVPELKSTVGQVVANTSTPDLMDKGTITAKKDDENSNNTNEASKVLGSALAGRGSADDLLKKALAELGTNPNDLPIVTTKGSKKRGMATEGGTEGGANSSEGESKGNDAFESLLAQMLGGGAPGAVEGGFGGGSDLASIPSGKKGQPSMNIFQYASTVYSELAHTANRVNLKPRPKATPSERALSSVTNSVVSASVR